MLLGGDLHVSGLVVKVSFHHSLHLLFLKWGFYKGLTVWLTILFIFVRNIFYLQISFISLSDRDLLLRTLSEPNLGLPPLLSKVSAKKEV